MQNLAKLSIDAQDDDSEKTIAQITKTWLSMNMNDKNEAAKSIFQHVNLSKLFLEHLPLDIIADFMSYL